MTLLQDLRQVSATREDLEAVAGTALAVATPHDAADVAGVLRVCREHGVGVTVRGGGSGPAGGAVAHGTVVLSTSRLDRIGPVEDGSVVAGAGVTVEQVHQRARRHGWAYGVQLDRRAATVGGTVATDAAGPSVLAHGSTRGQVLGLEAVLADGSVVRGLGGLARDATGIDLAQLLVGSEGTLGVVTAVRLRLVAPDRGTEVALVACPSVQAAVDVVTRVGLRAEGLSVAELLMADALALVQAATGLAAPVPGVAAPAYALLQARSGLADAVRSCRGVLGATVAFDDDDVARLLSYRSALPAAVGPGRSVDVTVPRDRVADLVAGLPDGAHVWGRLGDGTLEVHVADDPADEGEAVYRLAAGLGGSVGGEHGIGRLKTRWLHLSRPDAEVEAMRAVKAALDPTGLLNPGVLLP